MNHIKRSCLWGLASNGTKPAYPHLGRVVTKPVFGVPDKARPKPVSSAT